uniref:Ig-like domain-containing protein n=2 Tax=Gasterosteus aculeatus aculeatus TaxID=481459 RepID=G3P5L9_GASAC
MLMREEVEVLHTALIMKSSTKRQWVLVLLAWFLGAPVVDSSSRLLSVTSKVGNQAVLPCSWKQRLGAAARPDCHVQWATPTDRVFELRGAQRWEAEEFRGRVEVPVEKLGSGDCSLVISDVQIGDAGSYESFMVVGGHDGASKSQVFIQMVRLSVLDHKSTESRGPGEDLVLDLFTRHSVRVVFQDRNSSDWSVLWARGDQEAGRLLKHPEEEQLTFRRLRREDQGTYKVLDEHGLAVSTVRLSVEERPKALRVTELLETPTDGAARRSCSALLVFISSASLLHAGRV